MIALRCYSNKWGAIVLFTQSFTMKKWIRILLYSLVGMGFLLLGIGYYYYVPDVPVDVLNQKYGVKPTHYLQVDGINVHYKDEGLASDTVPLVLLHGTSSSLYTWDGWMQLLKDNRRIIRLDLPGFGLTGPHPKDEYSLDVYLEFLEHFLDKLEVEQCVLAGNSLGGEIAWRFALEHPQKVQKLILIGAAGYPVDVKELPLTKLPLQYLWLRFPFVRELSVKFSTREAIRRSLEYLYGDPEKVTEELVELYFDMIRREGNRDALTERMESFGNPSPWKSIPDIRVPTFILWGGQDQLIPVEHAGQFYRDLPKGELHIFSEAGHMPMEEIPLESAFVAEGFLNRSNNHPSVADTFAVEIPKALFRSFSLKH